MRSRVARDSPRPMGDTSLCSRFCGRWWYPFMQLNCCIVHHCPLCFSSHHRRRILHDQLADSFQRRIDRIAHLRGNQSRNQIHQQVNGCVYACCKLGVSSWRTGRARMTEYSRTAFDCLCTCWTIYPKPSTSQYIWLRIDSPMVVIMCLRPAESVDMSCPSAFVFVLPSY